MRNSIEELNQTAPEYRMDSAKEYAPLPDEFNRGEKAKAPKKKQSSLMRKLMMYLLTAGAVVAGVITPIIRVNPSESASIAEKTAAPTKAASSASDNRPTEPAAIRPAEATTPAPAEAPTEMPVLTGKIHITVYSDIIDWNALDEPYPSEILAEETFDASSFTEYKLPPLPKHEKYQAFGYVLTRYSGLAYLDTLYFENEEPHMIGTIPLGDTLTVGDLGLIPKSSEDIYQAEVHTVWLATDGKHHLEFYDGGSLFGDYDVGFPINSIGLCYLSAFPTPKRAGKTFAGWCDADNHMIDAVTFFDFYEKQPDAQRLEARDMDKPIPCRVYACWSDGSGGAPGITPGPTEPPTPEPVAECTVTCSGCMILVDGKFVTEGTFPVGTKITVYAWGHGVANFIMKELHAGLVTESGWIDGKPQEGALYVTTYSYKTNFTVTDDAMITVTFMT